MLRPEGPDGFPRGQGGLVSVLGMGRTSLAEKSAWCKPLVRKVLGALCGREGIWPTLSGEGPGRSRSRLE